MYGKGPNSKISEAIIAAADAENFMILRGSKRFVLLKDSNYNV